MGNGYTTDACSGLQSALTERHAMQADRGGAHSPGSLGLTDQLSSSTYIAYNGECWDPSCRHTTKEPAMRYPLLTHVCSRSRQVSLLQEPAPSSLIIPTAMACATITSRPRQGAPIMSARALSDRCALPGRACVRHDSRHRPEHRFSRMKARHRERCETDGSIIVYC